MEVERKTLQLGERDFESNINQKRTEIFSLDQKIKALYREKDVMTSDSEDRVKLDLKKEELEGYKRKHKKMQVFLFYFLIFGLLQTIFSQSLFLSHVVIQWDSNISSLYLQNGWMRGQNQECIEREASFG